MPAGTLAPLKGAAFVSFGVEGLFLPKLPPILLPDVLLVFSFLAVSITDQLSPEVEMVNTEQLPCCGDGDS